jgi:long-subunit fatty acid transport protein
VWLLVPRAAWAQSTEDNSVFDFSLPGARSRGIAGAFVAIADDATSVYSNPAGLMNLFRPEVSLEIRNWRLTSRVINAGHAFGTATGIGVDTINGIHDAVVESNFSGVSFLSFAYPRDRWSIGIFSHQLVLYERERQTDGIFFDCRGGFRGPNGIPPFCEQSREDGVDRLFPAKQSYDLNIRSTGAAVAVKANTLSVGVALQVFDFKLDATNTIFAARGLLKYAPANHSPQNVELVGRQTGDDLAVGVNVGALWSPIAPLTMAATFRQGPRFRYLATTTTGPATLGTPGVTFVNQPDNPFKVPDTWALGVAVRPSNYWRIGFEYDLVRFRQLFERTQNTATVATDPEGILVTERITIDNNHQFRLGVEYSPEVPGRGLLSFRGGVWRDPPHLPYFRVDDPATGYPAPGWALLFPKRDGETHGSAGIGFATQRHFQLDFAVDYARSVGTIAGSAIYRF